jgi:glycosyltransferase involved in cell wall biosynthesis
MRVLIICDTYPPHSFGGGGVTAEMLGDGLKKLGYEVLVVASYFDANKGEESKDVVFGLTPKAIWKNSVFSLVYYLQDRSVIKWVIKKFSPDVVYNLHQWGVLPSTIEFINSQKIPMVYRFGDEWLRLHYYKNSFWKKPLKLNSIIVNSFDLKKRISNFTKGKILVIKNGVDLKKFGYNYNAITKNCFRLLFVGRVVRHKGVDVALKVLNELIKEKFNASLTIVGAWPDKEYKEDIFEYIHKNNISENVKILGDLNHDMVHSVFNEHDVLLFTSPPRENSKTVEGCPNILLEAWSSGIVTIVRDSAGTREITKNGKNCLSVHSEEPFEYVALLKSLTKNGVHKKISKTARKIVEKEFNIEKTLYLTENALKEAVRDYHV